MTAQELVDRVSKLIPDNRLDPVAETCWFIAYRQAETFWDGLTTKDIAREILDGNPVGGPFHTLADIEGWIKESSEDQEPGEFDRWVIHSIREFFDPQGR